MVFLLGSPLSAPERGGEAGVPDANGVLEPIKSEFSEDQTQLHQLTGELAGSPNAYQAAFRFLIGRKGQDVANEVVQRAVLGARTSVVEMPLPLTDEQCRALEADNASWSIPSGLAAVGSLISTYPMVFGTRLLSTNFDPCIQQAITRAGGRSWRTALHGDGSLAQTEAEGCHVIHLHGYWWGSDTLHTKRQLTQSRPRLTASLAELLRSKLLIVSGYGGWDDVFTRAIFDVVRDDTAAPEVLWLFHTKEPMIPPALAEQLRIGIDRGRVSLYSGIDCNTFFPRLHEAWSMSEAPRTQILERRTNPVVVSPTLQASISEQHDHRRHLEGDSEDRPPEFSICVGREEELNQLATSSAKVLFITGIGGQGKSTLAAQHFQHYRKKFPTRLLIWRDCKELGETFENQIVSAVEALSGGRIAATDIAKQSIESMVQTLIGLICKEDALFVFDNVDNFVNLDLGKLTSSADLLVRQMLLATTNSQLLFTCRPEINYESQNALSLHLKGITLKATEELFTLRDAVATMPEIAAAHSFTDGHSLWLDLLALQTHKIGTANSLTGLLTAIGELPENTLTNIWSRLKPNEQLVLQSLAETVKPSSLNEVGDYLQEWMNFNKATKAIRALRAQNLLVVKELKDKSEVLELHPLIRQVVRTRFPLTERKSFMQAIIRVYERAIAKYVSALEDRPSFIILQNWTQKAELDIASGNLNDACLTLVQASAAFSATAFAREFTRTVRVLLESFNWKSDHSQVKEFDHVFEVHVECLCYLGDIKEVDQLLEEYSMTVPERDARYIKYCELKCFSKWIRKSFVDAVRWGEIGVALLDKSGIDAGSEIRHRLALAQRDAGNSEMALEYFAKGFSLSAVTDPDEFQEGRGAAFYGNIGRCLHFMGQVDQALICYQKSALLLEKDTSHEQFLNQGYVRWWIGELLLARNQYRLASLFIEAARKKWEEAAPALEKQLTAWRYSMRTKLESVSADDKEVERTCRAWIVGERLDT